jgi:BSD domain
MAAESRKTRDDAVVDDDVNDSFLSTMLRWGSVVKEVVVDDFAKEQHKYEGGEREQDSRFADALLPWELPGADVGAQQALHKQIELMAEEPYNFLESPPERSGDCSLRLFEFSWLVFEDTALKCLHEFPRLAEIRYALVPSRVCEEVFWRNFAARVYLLRKAIMNATAPDVSGCRGGGEHDEDDDDDGDDGRDVVRDIDALLAKELGSDANVGANGNVVDVEQLDRGDGGERLLHASALEFTNDFDEFDAQLEAILVADRPFDDLDQSDEGDADVDL